MITSLPILRRAAAHALRLATAAAGVSLILASPAQAHSDVAPYLEVEQVFDADLNGGGDVLTYTSIAAGIDASAQSQRVQAQISYRYERRIPWDDHLVDEDVHSGLAAVHLNVAPELLSLDAGAIATRGRFDSRGPAFGFSSADDHNIADIYGIFVGPTLATHAGPVAINANYHFGYVKVDDHSLADSGFPGGTLDRYDSSETHQANLSVGMAPGELPFGWTVSAGWEHEEMDRLDQEFTGKFIRGDIVVPLSPTFAITGGIGEEDLKSTQDDILRDSAGLPVVTPGGNLVADESRPRLIAYDQSGLIWDAGVIWRPSPRTELTARGGERYGGTTFVGTLKYQMSSDFAFSAVVYDAVASFGRLLITDINGLPTNFKVNHFGLSGGATGFGSCVFGKEPGSGRCLNDALQSVSSSNFRNRGIGLMLSGSRGPWDLSIGAGYANRKYLQPDETVFVLHDVTDESFTVEGTMSRKLTRSSGLEFDAYADWFDSGIPGNGTVFSGGVTGTYYHSFLLDRLQGEMSLGLYTTDGDTIDSTVASALFGLRYTF